MTEATKNKFFLFDPEGYGPDFFDTVEARDEAAKLAIKEYLGDDGWNEDVSNILVGEVTGKASAVNITHPIGEIDEDGYDENSEYWPSECTEKCDYEVSPLKYPKPESCPHLSATANSCGYFICDACNHPTGSHENDQD